MIELDVKWLSYQEIVIIANQFLTTHEYLDKLPVPIEEIIENDLNMDIIPTPNLQRDFGIEGYISRDFSSIYVDLSIYNNNEYRYKFTLAHEIGHRVIHRNALEQLEFDSISSWIEVLNQIDQVAYDKMEFQGYSFGGLILVPPHHLNRLFHEELPRVQPLIKQAKDLGIKPEDYIDYAADTMATNLKKHFEASNDVLIRRIKYDKLTQYF
ncbi:MAG: ImmA/IrrE family metallo-endopeptidase [Deltaproteobacteria bacterium]|nr:ImmA/IrrE family metallo-endopeptidase [Deltaproteobacteria bacterium]